MVETKTTVTELHTTTSTTAESLISTIKLANLPTLCTREHRYAYSERGAGTARIDLSISRDDDRSYRVRWNVDRGAGWRRSGWRSPAYATELEARTFADAKWGKLVEWCTTVETHKSNFQPDFTTH